MRKISSLRQEFRTNLATFPRLILNSAKWNCCLVVCTARSVHVCGQRRRMPAREKIVTQWSGPDRESLKESQGEWLLCWSSCLWNRSSTIYWGTLISTRGWWKCKVKQHEGEGPWLSVKESAWQVEYPRLSPWHLQSKHMAVSGVKDLCRRPWRIATSLSWQSRHWWTRGLLQYKAVPHVFMCEWRKAE